MKSPRISVFMALSLDGFIADAHGGVEWLNQISEETDHSEDYGYAKLIASVDLLVMGRNTFELVLKFDSWPYGPLSVQVISHKPLPSFIPEGAQVSSVKGSPEELIHNWQQAGISHIYLDGGQVVDAFLEADLIDEMTLTQVPAILGTGIPLFRHPFRNENWNHSSTKAYPNGFVQRVLKRKRAGTN